MPPPLSLVQQLRQGLASAVVSLAAVSVSASVEPVSYHAEVSSSPKKQGVPSATNGNQSPNSQQAPTTRKQGQGKNQGQGTSTPVGGCGAHDGGCAPSR